MLWWDPSESVLSPYGLLGVVGTGLLNFSIDALRASYLSCIIISVFTSGTNNPCTSCPSSFHFKKFSWHLGRDWLGKTLVVLPWLTMVNRSLVGTSVLITGMESLLLSFEFSSSISPDATITMLKLSLVRTEFVRGWIWSISYSSNLVSQLLLNHPYFQREVWGVPCTFLFCETFPSKHQNLWPSWLNFSKIAKIPSHWSAPQVYPLQSHLWAVLSGQRLMTLSVGT